MTQLNEYQCRVRNFLEQIPSNSIFSWTRKKHTRTLSYS